MPSDPVLRSQVVRIENIADKAGVHVRRWIYGEILDNPEVMDVMLDDYVYAKPFKKYLAPVMRKGIAQLYQVTPEKTAISLEKMLEAVIC